DSIGRVGVHCERPVATNLCKARAHATAGLAGLNAPVPRILRRLECAECFRDGARRRVAQLMAACAAVGVDDLANPFSLASHHWRNAVALRSCSREITLRRQLQK